jgi:SAM-dependent methyltransferase
MTALSLRSIPPLTPGSLELLSSGFAISAILFTAVELRIVDLLQEAPASSDELADRGGLSREGARRLLAALEALGVLVSDGDGKYRSTPLAGAALAWGAQGSVAPLFDHLLRHFYELFAHLPSAVRDGTAQLSRWRLGGPGVESAYAGLAKDAGEYGRFLAAMDVASRGVGELMARQLAWSGVAHLADLGHGGGRVARDLLNALPRLRVSALDLEPACAYAAARAAEEGLSDRMVFLARDVREPIRELADVDAVLLSGVISDFTPTDRSRILRTAFELLRPGGHIVVSETLFDEDRKGPFPAAMFSLAMLLLTGGDNFTPREVTGMLERAGFIDVQVYRNGDQGMRDTIRATKPSGG